MRIPPRQALLPAAFAVTLLALTALFISPPWNKAAAAPNEPPATPPTCAAGEALGAAGEKKEAKKVFAEVLKRDPSSACAASGLKELNAPEPEVGQCEIGDAFRDAHRDEDAIAAYKKALEKDPKSECATAGLKAAGPNRVTREAEEVTGSIPTALLILGGLILIGYGLLWLCRWNTLKRLLTRFPLLGPKISHVLRPRLTFTDFTDDAVEGKPGAPLTARVKERLGRMREEALATESNPEYDLDFGTPREEFADQVSESKTLRSALDSAGEVSEHTKLMAALIKIVSTFLPIRRFAVSGSLEPPAPTGPALILTLEEEGRSEDAAHLQGPSNEEPKAKDYMRLADPAAVWVQYGIACSLSGEKWDAPKAESQAFLREGLDCYQRGDLDEARKAFEQAIALDHTNWGAYVSLAVAEARTDGDYARSIASILRGIEKMKGTGATGVANA